MQHHGTEEYYLKGRRTGARYSIVLEDDMQGTLPKKLNPLKNMTFT